ncbi:hypothetical protein MKX01_009893 [Papaver californicum]|nr:hypothetical protein MKX01_009893 [Papaver californicum]
MGLKISIDQHELPVQVIKGGPKSSIYIIGVEVAERFAFYGTSGNLILYLTEVLGESTGKADQNVNNMIGAMIADSFLGQPWAGFGELLKIINEKWYKGCVPT